MGCRDGPHYAPELPIVGAVLGSPVGDPGEAFIKLNGGSFAGPPALVVAGLCQAYPVWHASCNSTLAGKVSVA